MSSGARTSQSPSPRPSPGVPGEGAKRILLLITDLEIGGTPTVVRELAIRLRAERFADVEVACLGRWGPVADQLLDEGVPVTAFLASGPADFPRVALQLTRLVRGGRFNTVLSFLIHANAVAAIASGFCGRVRFLQSIQTTQPTPRWHWVLQSIVQLAADRIIVPSLSTAQAAQDWAEIQPEKIQVIPNAVQTWARGARSSEMGDRVRIGFIGRLDRIKRVPDLLAAMKSLDQRFTLDIYGDGADRTRIEAEILRLGVESRVRLHGAIAYPQDAMGLIDVLVLPSSAEGFGLVLIEAMAAGVPVVATEVPGIRDVVVNGENGLLVPVASPMNLAAAIERIASDDSLRTRLVEQASVDVKARFSWDVVLPQYMALLAR